MTDNDDGQPTGMNGEINTTAAVLVSPRTVAAERYSEPPTTIVPDVGPTQPAELTRSSEAETEQLADRSHREKSTGKGSRCPTPVSIKVGVGAH